MCINQNPRYIGFGGGIGNGKCERFDSRILMSDGSLVPIMDVREGDEIFTVDEETNMLVPRKVLHKIDSGTKDSVELRLSNGLTLHTTKEHPYYTMLGTHRVCNISHSTKKKDGTRAERRDVVPSGIGWKRLEELKSGDRIAVPLNYPEGREFVGEDKSYLLGLLLGDGGLTTETPHITIAEHKILEKVKSVLPLGTMTYYKGHYQYSLRGTGKVGGNPLTNWLRELGIMGLGSRNKFIPPQFFGATKKEIAALVSGLIATDGWVDNNYVGYCSVSEQLVDDVQQLLLRLGIMSGKCLKMVSYKGTKRPYFTLQISDKISVERCLEKLDLLHKQPKLVDLVEKNKMKIPRGRNKFFYSGDLVFVRIASIVEEEPVQMYDLEVEGTHNFIANGIVAHNTLAACIRILQIAGLYPDNLVMIGRLKGTDLEASTKKTMLELLSPMFETGQAEYKAKDNKVVLENGSEIVFRHLEDVYSTGILGMNLGYFYIDQAEEVTEKVFDTLRGRLRRICKDDNGNEAPRGGILTFNMHGHDWIWRMFKKKLGKDKKDLTNPEEYGLIEASTLDNKDHLPKDYVDDLLSKDKEWIQRYVYGSWDVFSGQIFEDFNPDIHVVKHREPDQQSVRFVGIDPGFVDPFAVIWLAIEPGGQRYIYDEHYIAGQTTSWHADIIKMKETGQYITARYIDSANAQVIADLNAKGIYAIPAKKERLQSSSDVYRGGVEQLKNLFKVDTLTKKSGIIISDRCVNLIYELQQYSWKEKRGEFNSAEVPEDRHNHAIDALRYIILNYFDNSKQTARTVSMNTASDVLVSH